MEHCPDPQLSLGYHRYQCLVRNDWPNLSKLTFKLCAGDFFLGGGG